MATSRYARLEDEQRFVVPAVPPGATDPRLVEDRYLVGTRLRLRTVTDDAGRTHKLGHKVRRDQASPSAVWHTTCYLDEGEVARLGALEANVLKKRRWSLPGGGVADEFLGRLFGLVLVEGDRPHPCPTGGVEVSDDERFCGGALAALDDDGAVAVLGAARGLCR